MLGDLEALHQIELPAEIDRLAKVSRVKTSGIDNQLLSLDILSIDPGHRDPGLRPHAEPRTGAAAKIDNATHREYGEQLGDDAARRANREGGKETIKIVTVFVYGAGLLVSCTFGVHHRIFHSIS